MKTHNLSNEDFEEIVNKILTENKTLEEWAEIESDDMFQEGDYVGGFDGTEMEFCFSVFENENEYWFQLPLDDIVKLSNGILIEVELREADY